MSDHIDPGKIEELRAEITAELERLERSMRATDRGLRPVELDQTAVGRLSRMDELQNQAMSKNLREREDMKLGGLLGALRRIEEGTFGRCSECDAAIPVDRLEIFPEASTCVDCTA